MNTPEQPREPAGDYLWDRSGPADPLVERLEDVLAEHRLRARALEVNPTRPTFDRRREATARPWYARRGALAFAAALALVLTLGLVYSMRSSVGWKIESVSGRPLAAGRAVQPGRLLAKNTWLETDGVSSVTVRVPSIGTLDVAPNSRLRIEATGSDRHQVDMAHGHIRASITAPERLFFVRTRAAMAIDMGCRYDLTMPEDGPGLLTVIMGWVILEGLSNAAGDPYEARVPAGISCVIYDTRGPGTPHRAENESLVALLAGPDLRGWARVGRPELEQILAACGPGDGVTLWHLLSRVQGPERGRVLARLREVAPVPVTMDDASILRLDRDAVSGLWSILARTP